MNKRLKRNDGITVIALVITVIVLIILAGVTIAMVVSDNGIFTRANEAKDATEEAYEKEQRDLEYLAASMQDEWSGSTATNFSSGSGDRENDPYLITNGEELMYFADQVNSGNTFEGKYVSIVNSINLGNIEFTPIGLGTSEISGDDAIEWDAIENSFKGTLDGNGNVITGININKSDKYGVGLIGILDKEGTVKNINVGNGTVIGIGAVGGVVGASKGKIINCSNSASVYAKDKADKGNTGQMSGGIVGIMEAGKVLDCKNYGYVATIDDSAQTGRGKFAGGIVGIAVLVEDGEIKNCENQGNVLAAYQQAGGITSAIQSLSGTLTIDNCKNSGNIKAGSDEIEMSNMNMAGGITGWAYTETIISNCSNSGRIDSRLSCSGGIAGQFDVGRIDNCSNNGKIYSSQRCWRNCRRNVKWKYDEL